MPKSTRPENNLLLLLPRTTSASPKQQPLQTTRDQGSGSPVQSHINDKFDQSGNLDFLPALTGDPDKKDEVSSGPSNDITDVVHTQQE